MVVKIVWLDAYRETKEAFVTDGSSSSRAAKTHIVPCLTTTTIFEYLGQVAIHHRFVAGCPAGLPSPMKSRPHCAFPSSLGDPLYRHRGLCETGHRPHLCESRFHLRTSPFRHQVMLAASASLFRLSVHPESSASRPGRDGGCRCRCGDSSTHKQPADGQEVEIHQPTSNLDHFR